MHHHDDTTDSLMDEGLATTRPGPDYEPVRIWVVDSAKNLGELRASIVAELAAVAGKPPVALGETADHMVLIATELATNAIKYGRPPVIVKLMRANGVLLLDVADHDTSTQPYLAGTRPEGEGGFGLRIARRLAQDVGWYTEEPAKHVWAALPADTL